MTGKMTTEQLAKLTNRAFIELEKKMGGQFKAVDEQFKAVHENMDRGFKEIREEMDAKFEAVFERMDTGFNRMDGRFDELEEKKLVPLEARVTRIEKHLKIAR